MKKNQLKKFETIMFHYVRPKSDTSLSHLHSFDLDFFDEYVGKNKADIFTRSDISLLTKGNDFSQIQKKILLTFDDGLSDHYTYVYPILKKYGVSGIFFINSKNINNGMMDAVHKLHYLYGRLGWQKLIKIIEKVALFEKIDLDSYYDIELATKSYGLDTPKVACIKYALNHSMGRVAREDLINKIFDNNFPDLNQASFYLSTLNVREMFLGGMVFGYHGHEHQPFSRLSSRQVLNSIKKQNAFFDDLNISKPSFLSFPYGDRFSYSKQTLKILSSCDINFAFSSDSDLIKGSLVKMLTRTDCVEVIN